MLHKLEPRNTAVAMTTETKLNTMTSTLLPGTKETVLPWKQGVSCAKLVAKATNHIYCQICDEK